MNQKISESIKRKANKKYSMVKMNRSLEALLREAVEDEGLDKFFVVNEAISMWLKDKGYGHWLKFHMPVNRTFKEEIKYKSLPVDERMKMYLERT